MRATHTVDARAALTAVDDFGKDALDAGAFVDDLSFAAHQGHPVINLLGRSPGELTPRRIRRLLGGVDHHVGAELQRELASAIGEVAGHDGASTTQFECSDD